MKFCRCKEQAEESFARSDSSRAASFQGLTYRAKFRVLLIPFSRFFGVFETIALTYLFQDSTYQWKMVGEGESQVTKKENEGNKFFDLCMKPC